MKKNNRKINSREIIVTTIIVTDNDSQVIKGILEQTNDILIKNYQNYEILIVDNTSEDDTVIKIRNLHSKIPNIKIIGLSKKTNKDVAYTAGLDNCIGDYSVLLDFRTVSPNVIPNLIDQLSENYDIVIGKSQEEPEHKWSLSSLLLSAIERLSTHGFSYEPIHLLAVNRRVINSITRIRRKSRNLSYIAHSIGFRNTTIKYQPTKNSTKGKSPNFFETVLTVTEIVISNSFKPIRILAVTGMLISLLFLIYVIFVAVSALFFDIYFAPRGWVTLASVMAIMFFLLFSLLTLISEYIIRILNESRNEPLYFIAEEMDKSVINTSKNKLNVI